MFFADINNQACAFYGKTNPQKAWRNAKKEDNGKTAYHVFLDCSFNCQLPFDLDTAYWDSTNGQITNGLTNSEEKS